jgi:hypothetical protein
MSKLNHYADFAADFKRCRDPLKGRPVTGWCRMFKDGGDYVLSMPMWKTEPLPLLRVSPDNTATFVMPLDRMLQHSQTIVTSLWRVVPFAVERKRKGVYAVGYKGTSQYYQSIKATGTEYFEGIRFDLSTGRCLNPRPDMLASVDAEANAKWLHDVKRYKRGLKIRAKLGALDGFFDEVQAAYAEKGLYSYMYALPMWNDQYTTELVVESMRNEDYPPEILLRIVQEAAVAYRSRIVTRDGVIKAVDSVFNTHSIHYRKAYGVFGEW